MKGVGDGDVLLLDTVPLVRKILCPHIRSVSEHLMSRSEKTDLEHTVTVMADLGLNYAQIQLGEGKFRYQLEPDLEHISTFPDVAKESLNYWTCQLVSREVQEEYIRRATPKVSQQQEQRQLTATITEKETPMETEIVAVQNAPEVAFQKPANVLRMSKDFSNVKEVVSLSVTFLRGFACQLDWDRSRRARFALLMMIRFGRGGGGGGNRMLDLFLPEG